MVSAREQVAIVGAESEFSDAFRARPTITTPPPTTFTIPAPARLAIPTDDWDALVATRANTIVVGNEEAALGVWTAVWPSLWKPICWADPGRLSLPRHAAGTLILQGAHALSASAQRQVFDWLDHDERATRVLTTTLHPLYPLVEDGRFLEALYYRLNMLLLIL
jgi:hypothetical protein